MAEDTKVAQEEYVPPKFKKRKVQKGLRITINCDGKAHQIVWTKKGHMILTHHPDMDLNAELAMRTVGSCEICRCAEFIGGWRAGRGGSYFPGCPQTMTGVRGCGNDRKADRAWRKMRSKVEYKCKKAPKLKWPESEEEMHNFLQIAFARAGLRYEPKGEVYYDGIKPYQVSAKVSVTWHGGDGKNRFIIQSGNIYGLNYQRYATPDNYEMLIELVGRYLFRHLLVHLRNRKEEEFKQAERAKITRLVREYANNEIELHENGADKLQFYFSMPKKQVGAAAYILKIMARLKRFAADSIANR